MGRKAPSIQDGWGRMWGQVGWLIEFVVHDGGKIDDIVVLIILDRFPRGSLHFFGNGGRFGGVRMIFKLRADLSTALRPRSAMASWRKCSSAAAAGPGGPSMPFTLVRRMG